MKKNQINVDIETFLFLLLWIFNLMSVDGINNLILPARMNLASGIEPIRQSDVNRLRDDHGSQMLHLAHERLDLFNT